MSKLDKLEVIVKSILEKDPEARKDDMYLYYLFATKYGFLTNGNFYRLFKEKEFRNSVGLSPFESVSRCRRKLQAENEELRPSKSVQDARLNETSEYIDYAINGYKNTFNDFIDRQE